MRWTVWGALVGLSLALAVPCVAAAQDGGARPPRVAVLDFGETETGRRASAALSAHLSTLGGLRLVDPAQARAAARGVGYAGSLNMSVVEARDLGAAIGCDYFVTGDAQTVRRSSSAVPVYYEAYASIFVVSARTGRLLLWDRPHAEAPTPEEAERTLASMIPGTAGRAYKVLRVILEAEKWDAAAAATPATAPGFEDVPEPDTPAAKEFRPPYPYRRMPPAYPETASQAEAQATVDVSVEIDERGEVAGLEVVRWAGFGLDDAAGEVVRKMRFRPATRAGRPVPVRVLLRYNFRRPQTPSAQKVGEGEMRLGPLLRALIKNDNLP